jgi:hypothetical protein
LYLLGNLWNAPPAAAQLPIGETPTNETPTNEAPAIEGRATEDLAGETAGSENAPASRAASDDQADRVTLRPVLAQGDAAWVASRPLELRGRVQAFDRTALTLLDTDGKQRSIDSLQVQAVRFQWSNAEVTAALELFSQRKYRESITALNEARKTDTPRWQQQFVIGQIIQAALALGNTRTAGTLFLDLAASQPPPLLYADMPLCWTVQDVDKLTLDSAKQWLASEAEDAQLLGASWLLLGPEREMASKVLSQLQSSQNPVVAELAAAQAWRLAAPPETLKRLDAWLTFRDRMLQPLQLGPTEFLADRLQRVGETDLAMEQWMRIATLHADRYDRTRKALSAAAASLTRAGRTTEATKLETWIDELEGQ